MSVVPQQAVRTVLGWEVGTGGEEMCALVKCVDIMHGMM